MKPTTFYIRNKIHLVCNWGEPRLLLDQFAALGKGVWLQERMNNAM
jgi:hypothetical protein